MSVQVSVPINQRSVAKHVANRPPLIRAGDGGLKNKKKFNDLFPSKLNL